MTVILSEYDPAWVSGYISGFTCGEGSFCIAIQKSKNARLGYHARPLFQIELTVEDAPILEAIKEFFGFGSIYYPAPRTRVRKESTTCRFAVSAIEDCFRLADFFRANPLLGLKQKSFNRWCECLEIIAANQHTTNDGFLKLASLRSEINSTGRPNTFFLEENLSPVSDKGGNARLLKVWNKEEIEVLNKYLDGSMTRSEMLSQIERSLASINNKIVRIRKSRSEAKAHDRSI